MSEYINRYRVTHEDSESGDVLQMTFDLLIEEGDEGCFPKESEVVRTRFTLNDEEIDPEDCPNNLISRIEWMLSFSEGREFPDDHDYVVEIDERLPVDYEMDDEDFFSWEG